MMDPFKKIYTCPNCFKKTTEDICPYCGKPTNSKGRTGIAEVLNIASPQRTETSDNTADTSAYREGINKSFKEITSEREKCPLCGGTVISGKCRSCGFSPPAPEEIAMIAAMLGGKTDQGADRSNTRVSQRNSGKRRCPLCGEMTQFAKCPSCGYIIPDEEELDDMTRLLNTDPEDYPETDAARAEIFGKRSAETGQAAERGTPYKPPEYKLRDIRKEQNVLPAAPADNSPIASDDDDGEGDFYSAIASKLDEFLLYCGQEMMKMRTTETSPTRILVTFGILFMPKVVHIILMTILILFSFSQKKGIVCSAALMALLLIIKFMIGWF